MNKIKIILFWVKAFYTIINETLKNNNWHMIYVDFQYGITENGTPMRKQLIAKRNFSSFDVYWQNINAVEESK